MSHSVHKPPEILISTVGKCEGEQAERVKTRLAKVISAAKKKM